MSTFYISFLNLTSGVGSPVNPANSTQLYNHISSASSVQLSGMQPVKGDTFRISGTFLNDPTPTGTFNYSRIGYVATSWPNGEPWKIANESVGSVLIGPAALSSQLSATVNDFVFENVFINDLQLVAQGGDVLANAEAFPISGSYTFKNAWIQDSCLLLNIKNFPITFNGCTFVNASPIFTEYPGEVLTYQRNNTIIFNDCVFINSTLNDNGFNYGTVKANYCVFTNSLASVSANISATNTSGSVVFSGCQYSFTPLREAPDSFDNILINANNDYINVNFYNIPVTSADRAGFWTANGYSSSFWNTTRSGPGAFNFGPLSLKGHIGAFYFGPGDVVVELTSAARLTLNAHNISTIAGTSISANIPLPATLTLNPKAPTINIVDYLSIDFVGVPRAGSSPLVVDFTANVNSSNYRVTEYRWYFDYDSYPETYETSYTSTIEHTFYGYAGQAFSIKCVVLIESI